MRPLQETAILLVMTCITCLFILPALPSGGNGLLKEPANNYVSGIYKQGDAAVLKPKVYYLQLQNQSVTGLIIVNLSPPCL